MPAKVFFLDTQAWVTLLNASDSLHAVTEAEWNRLVRNGYSVLLTDWIVAETGNGLARTPVRRQFSAAVAKMLTSPRTRLVYVTEDLLARGLILYRQRSDKTWGLVDFVSFLVMQDEGVVEAFTNDEHFTQAGFQCLSPKP